jgi:RNA polymerase sigma-70 factor (ECF subfamily)
LAIAQRFGAEVGLRELLAIADRDRLADYPFYSAAVGELELRRGRTDAAVEHFAAALALARNSTERRSLERRIADCQPKTSK